MKSNVATIGFLLFFLFIFTIFSNSCAPSHTLDDSFAYTEDGIDARVTGNLDDISICADISSRPDAAGGEYAFSVKFHSPKSLEGVEVYLGSTGEETVMLHGEMQVSCIGRALAEPFLLLCTRQEIYSVKHEPVGECYITVCDENCDLRYKFTRDSVLPASIKGRYKGRHIEFFIEGMPK